MKMATEREVTLMEFRHELNALTIPRRIDEVIVHDASVDGGAPGHRNAERGAITEKRGWSDNGYHVMSGRTVIPCRPLSCAGAHTRGIRALRRRSLHRELRRGGAGDMGHGHRPPGIAELLERFHPESVDIHSPGVRPEDLSRHEAATGNSA